MKKEVEILFSIPSGIQKEQILKKLESLEFEGVSEMVDVYFHNPESKKFSPDKGGKVLECSRVRSKGGKAFLTYKKDYFDDHDLWQYSDEYEIEVSDFAKASQIIENHGFEELVKVENKKYIFCNEKYEVVFEDVTDLGYFLEVEVRGDVEVEDVPKEKDCIRDFVKKLDIEVAKELNSGKPELLIKKKLGVSF